MANNTLSVNSWTSVTLFATKVCNVIYSNRRLNIGAVPNHYLGRRYVAESSKRGRNLVFSEATLDFAVSIIDESFSRLMRSRDSKFFFCFKSSA